ncbi:TauD/TfdA family dioxygenase [Streptomyces sp. NPDC059118]|uniref:TauD/TfdA family dioxygenase n=1 Tax=unclassified Streptomyces TaxID=2593676 RepID=UPI0036CDCCD3
MLMCARTPGFEASCIQQRIAGAGGVAEQLRERGLVMVGGLTSREAVLAFARRFMRLVPHRDSDPDALTTIRDIGRKAGRPGMAGLGSGELRAHTEGSSVPEPPRLMLLVRLRPSLTGGRALLTDGQAVHDHLAASNPDVVEHMSLPGIAFYGDAGRHPSQIFTRHPDGRVSLRFRQDGLAAFSPLVERFLPDLREAIAAHERSIVLSRGQGYLIDNRRYFHARTAFDGPRRCVRALGMPLFAMSEGFEAGDTGRASPLRFVAGGTSTRRSCTAMHPGPASRSLVQPSASGSDDRGVR